MSIKPVHITRTVNHWLQKHRDVSEDWITSVVLWTPHSNINDEFKLEKIIKRKRNRKKVTLWVKDYSWRYLVYKAHMEKYP